MSEPSDEDQPHADDLRQHSQDPVEGPDDDDRDKDAPPRVHSEDPAEG